MVKAINNYNKVYMLVYLRLALVLQGGKVDNEQVLRLHKCCTHRALHPFKK